MASSRALTTASRLFCTSLRLKVVLHHHHSRRLTPRSFCTLPPVFPSCERKRGELMSFVNDSHFCLRIDMPGLTPDKLKISMDEHKNIKIGGKCESIPEFEEEGRVYEELIEAIPEHLEMEEFKVELKHGVLWVLIPVKEHVKQKLKMDRLYLYGAN